MSIKEENSFIFQPENFPYIEKAQEWCNENFNLVRSIFYKISKTRCDLECNEMIQDILIPKLANAIKKGGIGDENILFRIMIKCSTKNYIRKRYRITKKQVTLEEDYQPPLWISEKDFVYGGKKWGPAPERATQNLFIYLANYYNETYIKIYSLYYREGYLQSEIATRMGMYQVAVSRAIKEMTQFLIEHKEELRYILSDMLDDAGT